MSNKEQDMIIEPKVGEVWEVDTALGDYGTKGMFVVADRAAAHGQKNCYAISLTGNEYPLAVHRDWFKRRVELREGQVWRRPDGVNMRVVDLYKNGSAWLEATERQHHKYLDAEGMAGIAGMVRDGWTLVSEPSERKEWPPPSEEFLDYLRGELGRGPLKSDPVWCEPSFADRHKPLAEAFATIAEAMQTPRGILMLNRMWCDEQVANPPRWARDGRGVARGERFEAFKVWLCKLGGDWSERAVTWTDGEETHSRRHLPQVMSTNVTGIHNGVRQYVDQQCGEAPAWG